MNTKVLLEKSNYFLQKNKDEILVFELKDLQKIIKEHNNLYYNEENPIISDFEYDELFKKLEFLEKKYWILNKKTKEVWSTIKESSFLKVKHSRPMISLDNTYNEWELRDFDTRVKKNWNLKIENSNLEYALQFKFDWAWIELIYKNGKFVQAITRWNWIEWEDVTENVMQISNIPKNIDYKDKFEVRWEVILPNSSFEKINKEALETWWKIFSNPRNAASWSLRTIDTSITKERNLKFFAYDLSNFLDFADKTYSYLINYLEKLWFETWNYLKVCNWIDEIIKIIDNFWDIKNSIDFDIDWLVIKVNDISLWNKIWFTQHHPRYAIAYKFPAEIVRTKLISIYHSVWRTWTITPVANLEAVNVSWAIVKRANLHNYDELNKKWIMIWDYVWLKRAWEVIPDIIWPITEARTWKEIKIEIPQNCPICFTKLEKDDEKIRYYCPNTNSCKAQIEWYLIYAVGKNTLNIPWLWEKQIKLFLELWFIDDLISIFFLKNKKNELIKLDWYKEKSVSNILESIEKAKNQDIVSFLTALWINWVGKKTAKTLASIFEKKEDLLDFKYSIEELENLEDIWTETAKSIYGYFNNSDNRQFLWKILNIVYIDFLDKKEKNWKYSGQKFCITWSFSWITRDEIIEKLEKNWAKFISSVSKNLDFLLVWENPWSKLKKAKDLWVRVASIKDVDF